MGSAAPAGTVALTVFRQPGRGVRGFLSHGLPRRGLPRDVFVWRLRMLPRLALQAARVAVACAAGRLCGTPVMYGRLSLRLTRADGAVLDLGIASYRVVTTAAVNAIVDAFQNTFEVENFKYHAFGTGTNAEAVGDTGLQTELTTQYATDSTRPTGSQTEGGGANVYRTVATLDPDSAVAVTEHAVMSQAATGGGTCLDRSVFSVVNVAASGDTLAATYDLTIAAGS